MILTETVLHFRRDGNSWRCVDYPALLMLPGDRYGSATVSSPASEQPCGL